MRFRFELLGKQNNYNGKGLFYQGFKCVLGKRPQHASSIYETSSLIKLSTTHQIKTEIFFVDK